MKTLKFDNTLVPLILSGEKTSTWRLFDDKDLQEGDICEFVNSQTSEKFAHVKLTRVFEKELSALTEEDRSGHEKYENVEMLLHTFRRYYGEKVTPETLVKIAHFVLVP